MNIKLLPALWNTTCIGTVCPAIQRTIWQKAYFVSFAHTARVFPQMSHTYAGVIVSGTKSSCAFSSSLIPAPSEAVFLVFFPFPRAFSTHQKGQSENLRLQRKRDCSRQQAVGWSSLKLIKRHSYFQNLYRPTRFSVLSVVVMTCALS